MQTIEQIQDFKGKYPKQLWYLFFSEMWSVSVFTECEECFIFIWFIIY